MWKAELKLFLLLSLRALLPKSFVWKVLESQAGKKLKLPASAVASIAKKTSSIRTMEFLGSYSEHFFSNKVYVFEVLGNFYFSKKEWCKARYYYGVAAGNGCFRHKKSFYKSISTSLKLSDFSDALDVSVKGLNVYKGDVRLAFYNYYTLVIMGGPGDLGGLDGLDLSGFNEKLNKFFSGLFYSLFRNGFVYEANALKKKLALEIVKNSSRDEFFLYQKAAALVYLGRYREFLENSDCFAKGLNRYLSYFLQLEAFVKLVLGYSDPFGRIGGVSTEDAEFERLLSGKRVAIVGPAGVSKNNGGEIDSYDIVIRTNVFKRDDFYSPGGELGQRCDVSYYTNYTFSKRKEDLKRLLGSESMVFVYRNKENYFEAKNIFGEHCGRWVSDSPCNFAPNFANMHSIQRIVWDVLKFSPREVKIFNVTFFLGEMYNSSYKPRGVLPDKDSLGIKHDPLQSFFFTKKLAEEGVIMCDEASSNILSMGAPEYIKHLQASFGDFWKNSK